METREERKARLEALMKKLSGFYAEPWKLYHEPFHIVGPIYFVGNKYVSTFLIDTGEGLILIDPGFKETQYLVFDSIRACGFDPHDIKNIFLSHGHVDHIGGTKYLQEYSHAEVWLGQGDAFFFTERPDLIIDESHVPRFTIQHFYDYSQMFHMGNIDIEFVHTPGHTPGVTTFIFHMKVDGQDVTAAMHGGLGLNGLTEPELKENRLPLSLQKEYIRGLNEMIKRKVDIVLPSHNHNYDMLGRYDAKPGDETVFYDKDGWRNMLQGMLEKAKTVIPEAFEE
jgi:metallo-beta-lactamase class B